jgi:WhiB family redox-sensing transcriptional regulator
MSQTFPEMPVFEQPLCAEIDQEIYFSEVHNSAANNLAKRLCGRCIDKEACLGWAIKHEEFGIWGGTTTSERKKLRHSQGITLRAPETIYLG